MISKKIAIAGAILTVVLLPISLGHRASAEPRTTPPPNRACVIKGNISHNTGARLYHLPGMKDYEITVIDTSRGERWFCSEAEAIKNGWRKAPQ